MSINTINFSGAIRVGTFTSDPASPQNGMIYYNSTSGELRLYVNGAWQTASTGTIALVGQALNDGEIIVGNSSNLSASVDTDTVGDITADDSAGLTIKSGVITNTHISASAAIALSKLATLTATKVVVTDGSGYITVASYAPGDVILRTGTVPFTADQSMGSNKLTNLTNGVAAGDAVNKGQLDLYIPLTQKGAANGVASLDGSGKVPVAQLPNAIMEYQGMWNATTNSPTLADGVGSTGDVYRVSVAGSQDLGSGSISYSVGDYAIYNGTTWEKADTTDAVSLVNGFTGAVVLTTSDIAEGSNLYFTDERAQDAVGGALTDSATIDFTYNDGANTITAIVIDGSITNAKVATGIDAVKIADGSVSNTEFQYLDGVTSAIQTQFTGKANTALSNLASVAINADIVPASNNARDQGSDSLEFKDTWTHSVKHNDATNPDLNIQTTGNNGSVITTANGTGNSDVKATKARRSQDGASSNFIEEQYFDAITLTASQTAAVQSNLTFAFASYEGLEVVYKIKEASTNRVRIGTLRVATNGTDTSAVDSFVETGDVGVTWTMAINGANLEVKYTTTANNKTMRADVKRIRA